MTYVQYIIHYVFLSLQKIYGVGLFVSISISIYTIVLVCVPAIQMELAAHEVDKIKDGLARSLVLYTGNKNTKKTQKKNDLSNHD